MNTFVSSRTPEGNPAECPVCRTSVRLQFSDTGDATCPACGALVWIVDAVKAGLRRKLADQLSVQPDEISDNDLKADSLDIVELVMDFEDQFEITIPDDQYQQITTIDDFLQYLKDRFPETDQT